MLPPNFEYKKLTLEELRAKFPSMKHSQAKLAANQAVLNALPFAERFREDKMSNWVARKATEEVKEKHEILKKELQILSLSEEK